MVLQHWQDGVNLKDHNFLTISSPAFIRDLIAVGAEYQTVTLIFFNEFVPGLC